MIIKIEKSISEKGNESWEEFFLQERTKRRRIKVIQEGFLGLRVKFISFLLIIKSNNIKGFYERNN